MNLTFLIPGKCREKYLQAGYDEYVKRLSGYAKTTVTFLPEERRYDNDRSSVQKALEKEADRVLSLLKEKDRVVLLDVHARPVDSKALAVRLKALQDQSASLVFVLGSSNGLSDRLRKRADFAFALSPMTFTHYLALLLLLEQVYRAMKINAGEKYDK